MKNFFEKPTEKLFNLAALDKDTLIYRLLPRLFMELSRKYFRLEVEGLEHIPRRGRALITPNHSGFSGLDAMILGNEIFTGTTRVPRVLSHHFWFLSPQTSIPAQKLGFVEATTANGLNLLNKNNLVVLFPEGEHGNFKPTSQRYNLQEFKRGFVRMALKTKSPIIPTLIIGAEETHINLSTLKFSKFLRGAILPLPLNFVPLPARWKIRFFEPIYLPFSPEDADNVELVHEIAAEIQQHLQKEINRELKARKSIF
jgi:1-acyl-sn-glycerol-3-phosphate acyltransferase